MSTNERTERLPLQDKDESNVMKGELCHGRLLSLHLLQ